LALHLDISEVFDQADSVIVLAWLAAQSANWRTFIANGILKIQDNT
jgi:hypothetical protein